MKTIKNICCVGAGLIGQGWATHFSSRGCAVILHDLDDALLRKAVLQIKSNLEFLETNGLLSRGEADASLARIRTTDNLAEAVATADYVQESAYEDYQVKKKLFQQMDVLAPEEAILASSSSALLMTEIQKCLSKPERCVSAHPYLPVHLMPLVEVVGGKQTSSATAGATFDFMEKIGKSPILLNKEVPGFIVNRLQAALTREAIDLVESGVASAEDVDAAYCLSAGLRGPLLGPLLRIHLVGDGIEHFFEKYSQSYRIRLETMADWTSFPDRAAETVTRSVNEMEVVKTKSLEEIKSWRDERVARILRIMSEQP